MWRQLILLLAEPSNTATSLALPSTAATSITVSLSQQLVAPGIVACRFPLQWRQQMDEGTRVLLS